MEDLETAIDKAGGFGWYQMVLLTFSLFPLMFVAANMGATIFEAMIPKVRCENPSEVYLKEMCSNWTYEIKDIPVPQIEGELSHCIRYDFTFQNTSNISLVEANFTSCNLTEQALYAQAVPCTEWLFDNNVMRSTIVTEFNLVCDDIWEGYFVQSALMLGVGVGSILSGILADKLGRRTAFLFSCIGTTIFGISVAFTTSYISYCVTRFFLGLFVFSAFPALFVLNSEMTVRTYRSLVGQILELSFPLGFILLSLVSFALRDWRHIQLVISAPFALGIVMWWFLPESPRWFYHKGKETAALKIISDIYTINRTKKAEDQESEPVEAPPKYEEVDTQDLTDPTDLGEASDILKHPFLRGACVKLFYNWFSVSCVYYGLTLNAADLGGDPFAILCLNSIAELIAVILTVPLVNIIGRRITGFLSEILAGILCISIVFMPKVILPVAILGKFSITIAFSTMYIHTNEIYPTPIRTSALGVCNGMARLGGVVSPLILMSKIEMFHFPYIAFGILSIIGGTLVLTLPETRCTRLPQTIQEGEHFISADRGVRTSCKRTRAL